MKKAMILAIGVALAAMVVASSASAKWVIGNGTTDIAVTGPNPALPGQVCTTHIEGFAGLSTSDRPRGHTAAAGTVLVARGRALHRPGGREPRRLRGRARPAS